MVVLNIQRVGKSSLMDALPRAKVFPRWIQSFLATQGTFQTAIWYAFQLSELAVRSDLGFLSSEALISITTKSQ